MTKFVGYVARIRDVGKVYKILISYPEQKKLLWRRKYTWENSTKMVGLVNIQRVYFVKTEINIRIPQKREDSLPFK
jgi:hypothetical protein